MLIQKTIDQAQTDKTLKTLCQIPIIMKLKNQRGLQYLRRLMKITQFLELNSGQICCNRKRETYLVLLIEGMLTITYETSKNIQLSEKQLKTVSLQTNSHYVIDSHVLKSEANVDCKIFIVRQKYILQIFQGILSFPYLTRRLEQLKNNQLFQSLEKRVISKIAFDLQELTLPIGFSVNTQNFDTYSQKNVKLFYYIISGEIKIYKNSKLQKNPICVLGPHQIFGDFSQKSETLNLHNIQVGSLNRSNEYYGVIITETSTLFKIKVQSFINSLGPCIQYENKRSKWRQNRLCQINQKIKATQTCKTSKKTASFLEKQLIFKSLYGEKAEEISKLRAVCNEEQSKCQNREIYYSKKLDKILNLQKKRYGEQNETIILFPMKLERRLQNRTLSLSRKFKDSPKNSIRKNSKEISKTYSASSKMHSQPSPFLNKTISHVFDWSKRNL